MVITSFPQVFAARQPLELEISYSKAKRIILRDVLRTDRNFHYFRCEHILPSFSLSPSLPRRPSPAPTFHTSLLSPLSLSFMFALTHSLSPPLSLSLQSQEEPEEGPQNPTHLCHVSSRSEPLHFRVTTSFVRALRLKMACVCRGIGII